MRYTKALTLVTFASILLSALEANESRDNVVDDISWMRMEHLFSSHPGSSFGGKPMLWSHFETLQKHDRNRHSWIVGGVKSDHGDNRNDPDSIAERKDTEVEFSLRGSADPNAIAGGLYWVKLSIGTPPREFAIQIDTGSDLFWVQCQPCTQCPSKSNLTTLAAPFDPSQSSTYQSASCTSDDCFILQTSTSHLSAGCQSVYNSNVNDGCYYEVVYGDSTSSTGHLGYDKLHLPNSNGTTEQTTVQFGCSFNQSGSLFYNGRAVDGLIGLGRASYSVPSVLSNNSVLTDTFSHCLGGEESGGGALILGAQPYLGSNPQSTSLLSTGLVNHYYVNVTGVSLGGAALSGVDFTAFGDVVIGAGTIFDSGTSLAIVPDVVYTGMVNKLLLVVKLQGIGSVSGQTCWSYPESTSINLPHYFPNASISFDGGATLNLTPENYMLLTTLSEGPGQAACFGWQSLQNSSAALTIIGDIILRNKLVTYDNVNLKLKWVDYNCSNPINVTSSPFTAGGGVGVTAKSSGRLKLHHLSWTTATVLLLLTCLLACIG